MSSYSNQSNQGNQQNKLELLKSIPTHVFKKRIKELLSKKYSLYEILEWKRDKKCSSMLVKVVILGENSLNFFSYCPVANDLTLLNSLPFDQNSCPYFLQELKNKLNQNTTVEELDAAHDIDDDNVDVQEVDDLIFNFYGDC